MRGKNYLVIADSGLAYKVQAVGPADSLDALQGLVGSWSGYNALIELIESMHTVEGTIDCWANEEGQFRKGFQTNIVASALCKKEIKGPVIFTGSTKDGETIPVPEEFIMGAVEAGVELEANGKQYTWPEVCIELMEQEQKFLEYLEMEERHND